MDGGSPHSGVYVVETWVVMSMEGERKRRPRGLWYALGLLGVDMGVSLRLRGLTVCCETWMMRAQYILLSKHLGQR